MLPRSLTSRAVYVYFATAFVASAFMYACSSDDANGGSTSTTGGAGNSAGSVGNPGGSVGNPGGSVGNPGGSVGQGGTIAQGGSVATGGSIAQGGSTAGGTSASQGGTSGSAGLTGTAGASCQGVTSAGDCTAFGTGTVCDRSESTNPRICTCGTNLTWDCVSLGGGGASGRGGATGAAGASCQGVTNAGDCTVFGTGTVCDRSASTNPRICTCGTNLTWDCVSLGGGGASGRGGATGAAGASCQGVTNAGDCTVFGTGTVCDRSATTNPRICTCGTNLTWDCVSLGGGGASGGGASGGGASGGGASGGGASGRGGASDVAGTAGAAGTP